MLHNKSVTAILGIENTLGYHTTIPQQSFLWLPSHSEACKLLFCGRKPLILTMRYPLLTFKQQHILEQLNISIGSNQTYVGGLISLQTKANIKIDLPLLKNQIDQKIVIALEGQTLPGLVSAHVNKQNELFCNKPTANADIRIALQELLDLKKQIGLLLLPKDFIRLLTNPDGFINTTLHYVGIYALTFIKEFDPMFFENHNNNDDENHHPIDLVDELANGLLIAPDTTPLSVRESNAEASLPVTYPTNAKNRKFNNRKSIESKARVAARIYSSIKPRLKRLTPKQKALEIAKIRSLRPSMRTLKAYYLAKGDSKAIVDMLVTHKKYPDLPQVHITKRCQQVLIDILEGKENQHTEFIRKGFKL